MSRVHQTGLGLCAFLALTVLLRVPSPAGADESTASAERAAYVEELEAICRPRAQATQRVMKGVREEVRRDRIKPAARKFARGTALFDRTVALMSPVARPPADAETLRRWFVYLERQEGYLKAVTRSLRAGRTIAAQRLIARFIHTGNLANDVVLSFGFNYCSFKFSRFG
jgi:hypothetical protein